MDRVRIRGGQGGLCLLLASTSMAALLVGGGAPPAMAVPLCYTGPFPFTNSGTLACITINNTSFTGNVVNNGKVTPGAPTGINVTNASTINGQISNAGTINVSGLNGFGILIQSNSVLTNGIVNSGTISAGNTGTHAAIYVTTGSTFSGGITNSGTLAAHTGIGIFSFSTFSGGITNSGGGKITGKYGVYASSVVQFGSSSVGGGLTNAGVITGTQTAIYVKNVSTFQGGIANSGTISSVDAAAIFVGNFGNVSTFAGGISNGGTISAAKGGIQVGNTALGHVVTSFGGGITNSGSISAGAAIFAVAATFSGGITNAAGATMTAGANGIFYNNTVFSGGITNAGMITSHGSHDAIGGVASTFIGDITNTGTIVSALPTGPGVAAINVRANTYQGRIFNGGTIIAAHTGIQVQSGTGTFTSGITNSGKITAVFTGIQVQSGVSNFAGGITNTGGITGGGSQNGIFVGASTFAGGITNAAGAVISAGGGIQVGPNVVTFSNGITNAGTISTTGSANGIAVFGHTFSGGITNAAGALIAGSHSGIHIGSTATSFGGGITNNGAITVTGSGKNGISDFAKTLSGGITNTGTISTTNDGIHIDTVTSVSGNISNNGTITAPHAVLFFERVSTFTGNIVNSGKLTGATNGAIDVQNVRLFAGSIINTTGGTITANSSTAIRVHNAATFTGAVINAGRINAPSNNGISISSAAQFGSNTPGGGVVNSGTISAGTGIHIGSNVISFAGGVTNIGKITATNTGILVQPGNFSGAIANSGNITGGIAAIDVSGASNAITINQTGGTISGAIHLSANGDTLNISGGVINGNITDPSFNDTINFNIGSGNTFTYNNNFTGLFLVNINSGTVVLNGGGNSASELDVAGGTLAGTGSVSAGVVISGIGAFAPGTPGGFGTFTVHGPLSFNPGSLYGIDIAPGAGNNSAAAVTGTAFLTGNGTVVVTPLKLGHYNTNYVILTDTARFGTFAGLTINGSFAGTMTLDYSVPNEVLLDVTGTELIAAPPGANQNELNLLNGINNGIIASPTLPPQFANLGNLSGPGLLNALSLLSGEEATGGQAGAFNLLTQFLDVVFDQDLEDGGAGGMAPFAPERADNLPPDIALAYARVLKAPPRPPAFEQPWHVWGAGFGGYNKINGDPAIGSHDVTARDGGGAAGADYRPAPDTVVGFALAGGGFNWGLSQGLGGGRADSFEAAVYGRRYFGPAYVAGAAAFANHWMTTNRTAAFGDQLSASFNAQSFGARLEAGDRFAMPVGGALIGVTPYAALQAQSFHTPSYTETDLTGGGFALSFNSMDGSDTRTELGARLDDRTMLSGLPLVLRGRLAWAHDWVSNSALNAVFQALPGAAFTVNGAKSPADSALTSASAELWLSPNWSVTGKFDGEFANGAQTYTGTGTVRYRW